MMRRVCRIYVWFLLVVSVTSWSSVSFAGPVDQAKITKLCDSGFGVCENSRVAFEASSLEVIYLHPEEILEDVDAFWTEDPAYRLVAKWHEGVGYPVPPPGWQQVIEKFAAVPAADRRSSEAMKAMTDLVRGKDIFAERAVPHICSFLPDNGRDIGTTVYFTSVLAANAFQKDYKVVFNIAHPDWEYEASNILNNVVHEVFHVAFYRNECLMAETPYHSIEKYDVCVNLMNEGLATYVAYRAQDFYPTRYDDYAMLEDMAEVKRLIGRLNELLAAVDDVSPDEFRQRMWSTGVQERALYIPGAHMARTIDERLGRAALVRTMGMGPRTFIRTYNTLAESGLRIHEYRLAESLSAYQRLREAVVGGDYETVSNIVAMVAADEAGDDPAVHVLNTTGWLLLYRGQRDLAEQVFKQYARLFPDSSNPYEGLGKIYLVEGHLDLAAEAFRELLRVSPGSAVASEMLEALGENEASDG